MGQIVSGSADRGSPPPPPPPVLLDLVIIHQKVSWLLRQLLYRMAGLWRFAVGHLFSVLLLSAWEEHILQAQPCSRES